MWPLRGVERNISPNTISGPPPFFAVPGNEESPSPAASQVRKLGGISY
jgi:hypothetical protein